MEPDPSDLPTPPSIPVPPAQQGQPRWPRRTGDQPPTQRLPWPLLAVIAGIAIVVLMALLFGLLLSARGGTTTVLVVAPVDQTATAISAQATTSAASTASANATGTASRATATPRPPSPAVHIVTAQGTVTTGSSVAANCPNGELALSGGWSTDSSAPIYNSSRSGGSSGNGWRVFPLASSGAQVTAYVVCLQHTSGTSIAERLTHLTVGTGASAIGDATCNGGEVSVGGGFANPTPGVELVQFVESANFTGFRGTVVNHTGSSQVVTVYAECLSAAGAHPSYAPPVAKTVSPGASDGLQSTCPQGVLLMAGSYDDLDGGVVIYNFSPSGAATWQAQIKNQSANPSTFHLDALCLSFS